MDINAYAGAVRIFPDKVLLVNASGLQGTIGYKGMIFMGKGPFESTAPVNPSKAETASPWVSGTLGSIGATASGIVPAETPSVGKPGKPEIITAGQKLAVSPADQANAVTSKAGHWPGITGAITHKATGTEYLGLSGLGKIGDEQFYVIGEAPFTVTHAPGKVTLTTQGRRRIFQMPIPADIVPANLLPPVDSLPEDFKLNWSVGGWINWPWAVEVKVDGLTSRAAGTTA